MSLAVAAATIALAAPTVMAQQPQGSGEVRRVRGVLPIAMCTKREGRRGIIVPADNAEEAAVVEGLEVYPVRTLRQAADFLGGALPQRPFRLARIQTAQSSYCRMDDAPMDLTRSQRQNKPRSEVFGSTPLPLALPMVSSPAGRVHRSMHGSTSKRYKQWQKLPRASFFVRVIRKI